MNPHLIQLIATPMAYFVIERGQYSSIRDMWHNWNTDDSHVNPIEKNVKTSESVAMSLFYTSGFVLFSMFIVPIYMIVVPDYEQSTLDLIMLPWAIGSSLVGGFGITSAVNWYVAEAQYKKQKRTKSNIHASIWSRPTNVGLIVAIPLFILFMLLFLQ